jgi:hypothetical protein
VICICDYQINTTMQQFAYTGRSLVHMHGIATLRYASTSLSSKRKIKRKIADDSASVSSNPNHKWLVLPLSVMTTGDLQPSR